MAWSLPAAAEGRGGEVGCGIGLARRRDGLLQRSGHGGMATGALLPGIDKQRNRKITPALSASEREMRGVRGAGLVRNGTNLSSNLQWGFRIWEEHQDAHQVFDKMHVPILNLYF